MPSGSEEAQEIGNENEPSQGEILAVISTVDTDSGGSPGDSVPEFSGTRFLASNAGQRTPAIDNFVQQVGNAP